MDFINHTISWCEGEIFEGKMFSLFGFVVLIIALLYWKFGHTNFAKAMFVPLLIVGLLCSSGGLGLIYSNTQRIPQYQKEFSANQVGFIQSEKERTENFIKWYPYTMYGMSVLIILGLCSFLFLGSPYGRSIGLSLVVFGVSILFLDHFSEERADGYHQKIQQELVKRNG